MSANTPGRPPGRDAESHATPLDVAVEHPDITEEVDAAVRDGRRPDEPPVDQGRGRRRDEALVRVADVDVGDVEVALLVGAQVDRRAKDSPHIRPTSPSCRAWDHRAGLRAYTRAVVHGTTRAQRPQKRSGSRRVHERHRMSHHVRLPRWRRSTASDARHRDGAVPDAPGDRLPGQQYLLRTGALDAQADVASRVLDGVGQGGAERLGGNDDMMSPSHQLEQPLPDRAHLEVDVVAQDDARRIDAAVASETGDERAQGALPTLDDDRLPRATSERGDSVNARINPVRGPRSARGPYLPRPMPLPPAVTRANFPSRTSVAFDMRRA